MRSGFVLPLLPLNEVVLLPGGRTREVGHTRWERGIIAAAKSFGDTVVASLKDGDSVHEIGVTAAVDSDDNGLALRGLDRCRLLALVRDDLPMVEAAALPDESSDLSRAADVGRLLGVRYERLCGALGRRVEKPPTAESLAALTWRVVGGLRLPVDQQQGFLAVTDSLTRGRLLLAAMREIERRERFLRPWAHLRSSAGWN